MNNYINKMKTKLKKFIKNCINNNTKCTFVLNTGDVYENCYPMRLYKNILIFNFEKQHICSKNYNVTHIPFSMITYAIAALEVK